MKSILVSSLLVVALVCVGCENTKKADAAKDPLKDIAPPAPTHPDTVAGPVTKVETGPVVAETFTPPVISAGPARGQKYTVQKGDTLWSLSQKTYGDGKQYKKIVAANPATIKNDRLIAGTTISLP